MTLPIEYDALSVQREIDALARRLNRAEQHLSMFPLADAPLDPKKGWIAVSDGTGGGFDAVSGEGVYRYNGSAWVFVG